ncbi:hypothetical protein [Methanobacterium alcaliphilum]|uniref:hypothetical protein n=1 Tax=Methanobacterium alcaliphilum TaxID=392018 RepID=UPI00200B6C4F|nr:hypothetical protein [Methanobacterium alcaliphilum]
MIIIAIEGIDGSGKTTQANMLVKKLNDAHIDAEYMKTIYITLNILPFFNKYETILSPRKDKVSEISEKRVFRLSKIFKKFFGYLYALTTYIIIKIRYKNRIAVCDRYFYQFFYDLFGEKSKIILKILPKPDYTFFLNGNLETFCSRMDDSFDVTVPIAYYEKILRFYQDLSKEYNFIQLDASESKTELNKKIYNNLIKLEGFDEQIRIT